MIKLKFKKIEDAFDKPIKELNDYKIFLNSKITNTFQDFYNKINEYKTEEIELFSKEMINQAKSDICDGNLSAPATLGGRLFSSEVMKSKLYNLDLCKITEKNEASLIKSFEKAIRVNFIPIDELIYEENILYFVPNKSEIGLFNTLRSEKSVIPLNGLNF